MRTTRRASWRVATGMFGLIVAAAPLFAQTSQRSEAEQCRIGTIPSSEPGTMS